MNESIPLEDLKALSPERFEDAIVLYDKKRYEGSFYMAGYAIEFLFYFTRSSQDRLDSCPLTRALFAIL